MFRCFVVCITFINLYTTGYLHKYDIIYDNISLCHYKSSIKGTNISAEMHGLFVQLYSADAILQEWIASTKQDFIVAIKCALGCQSSDISQIDTKKDTGQDLKIRRKEEC